MKISAKRMVRSIGRVVLTLPATSCFLSCGMVREELPECPRPVFELRFVYDYNMEYANAFHNQVDCLSAYIFTESGELVGIEKVTDSGLLSDESYRMRPSLAPGRYHVVAYGGMDCEKSSFSSTNMVSGSRLTDLQVHMHGSSLTDKERYRLHNHYYGSADFTVDEKEDTYATVPMMRNTNSIQVALQHMNGKPVDCNDFIFEITDDNNDFDHENNLLATGEIKYNPWNTDNRSTGVWGENDQSTDWTVALAQFTTSRLVKRTAQNNKQTPTTLQVRRAQDGQTVFSIPLVNYMLLFKHDNSGAGLDAMDDQEYLDRENTWNFVFFLDENNVWIRTRFIVNDWEVRLNGADI